MILLFQDIENFKKWKWNETLDTSQSYLTGTGYEELYDIGKRIREKYSHLLELVESENVADHFYFRTTNEQRTITSSMAFVHGLREDTKLNFTVDGPWTRDDIIRVRRTKHCFRFWYHFQCTRLFRTLF